MNLQSSGWLYNGNTPEAEKEIPYLGGGKIVQARDKGKSKKRKARKTLRRFFPWRPA